MKRFSLIIILSASLFASGQKRNVSFDISPQQLALAITAKDSTTLQKVTSIFNWVTSNIAYNVKAFGGGNQRDVWLEEDDDTASPLKPLNQRVSELVLKRGTAVCDGYARLFKTLCDAAGVYCETITGFAKTRTARIDARFTSNHKWNAVYIDSGWHLLDATWASGYINYRNEFVYQYDAHFFLTPPAEFMMDHHPENLRWLLIADKPVAKEYAETPFKSSYFKTNYIRSFQPQSGIIEAALGDTITFEIEPANPNKLLWVSASTLFDSLDIFLLQCCGAVKPQNKITGNKVSCIYKIESENTEWLHLIYDDQMIMRYKINVKKNL
ncbi:MAG TPA: transglutaminase domain-containing protein [Chitinophagaceae bacterium]|nr:transglutaminase domain-containing protein [Chitinophagaceae bacterium]